MESYFQCQTSGFFQYPQTDRPPSKDLPFKGQDLCWPLSVSSNGSTLFKRCCHFGDIIFGFYFQYPQTDRPSSKNRLIKHSFSISPFSILKRIEALQTLYVTGRTTSNSTFQYPQADRGPSKRESSSTQQLGIGFQYPQADRGPSKKATLLGTLTLLRLSVSSSGSRPFKEEERMSDCQCCFTFSILKRIEALQRIMKGLRNICSFDNLSVSSSGSRPFKENMAVSQRTSVQAFSILKRIEALQSYQVGIVLFALFRTFSILKRIEALQREVLLV
jgi:hypothetical protein